MRWTLAAKDICFTNKILSYFATITKNIPIIRFNVGFAQEGMNLAVDKLNNNEWVHIYPQGVISNNIKLKKGLAYLIYTALKIPNIIMITHSGLNSPLYIPHRISINICHLTDVEDYVTLLKANNTPCRLAIDLITAKMEKIMAEKIINQPSSTT